ncbi:MAG: SMC-Scp complex subunit ScpB [Flexilinea sp.]
MTGEDGINTSEYMTTLEAVLFVASGPVSYSQIAEVLSLSINEVKLLAQQLADAYREQKRGIRILFHDERMRLMTAPETASAVEKFLGIESSQKLSRAAQETLTIIAYRQPVTRPVIDSIRGVSSDGVVRGLLNRGLVEETGRAETPGRPVLYSTTQEFLQYFGLSSINELPPFEVEADVQQDIQILKA